MYKVEKDELSYLSDHSCRTQHVFSWTEKGGYMRKSLFFLLAVTIFGLTGCTDKKTLDLSPKNILENALRKSQAEVEKALGMNLEKDSLEDSPTYTGVFDIPRESVNSRRHMDCKWSSPPLSEKLSGPQKQKNRYSKPSLGNFQQNETLFFIPDFKRSACKNVLIIL